jgi:hypothetical protein
MWLPTPETVVEQWGTPLALVFILQTVEDVIQMAGPTGTTGVPMLNDAIIEIDTNRFHQCFLQTFSQTANEASSPWLRRSLVDELACFAKPRVSAEFAARRQRLFEDLRFDI